MTTTTNIMEFGKTAHTLIISAEEKIHHCVKCDQIFTCGYCCNWLESQNSHWNCDQAKHMGRGATVQAKKQ
jgi:hypothetical protein